MDCSANGFNQLLVLVWNKHPFLQKLRVGFVASLQVFCVQIHSWCFTLTAHVDTEARSGSVSVFADLSVNKPIGLFGTYLVLSLRICFLLERPV